MDKDKLNMDKDELKYHIDEIIKKSFEILQEAYDSHKEPKLVNFSDRWKKKTTRLVFPRYGEHRSYETRISEQELRFCFVEAFNSYCDRNNLNLFYSVETPTEGRYVFSENGVACDNPHAASKERDGQSASFDMVIYDENMRRRCLIEFKALNAAEHEHLKDFVKLNNPEEGDDDVLRYFIEILKFSDNGTVNSLHSKVIVREKDDREKVYFEKYEEGFRCYDLKKGKDITVEIKSHNP